MSDLNNILRQHKRIAIVGGPKTGKTTLSRKISDRPVVHTDDAQHLSWEFQPQWALERVTGRDTFILEGVQAARTLRKGLKVDAVIVLDSPHQELSEGQRRMSVGVQNIFKQWQENNPEVPVFSLKLSDP